MKKNAYLILLVSIFVISCSSKNYRKLDSGVLIHLHDTVVPKAIKLDIVADNIIHVTASPDNNFSSDKSLMVVDRENSDISWNLEEYENNLLLSTSSLQVKISLENGEINFLDKNGNEKLMEQHGGGKSFETIEVEGNEYYTIRQIFESPDDEAFYGLGQHQHDYMNYKGKDVDLYQHNIVAVVPFLVSSKGYGILWDNYSRTKFGDPRDYQNISSLKLYSEDGKEGGLTAKYVALKDPQTVFVEKIEREIDYQYLEDLHKIPQEFPMSEGKVIWTGSIGSDASGIHKFMLYSAGYFKMWFGDELIMDNWRQTWNPWSRIVELDMVAGEKYPVRIEWIPDGGECYIAIKYKSPVDPAEQNKLSLWSEVADQIDYYFIGGDNLDDVISGYRHLTGKASILPKWAMGFWQSRERYKTQDELIDVVKEFRKRHIPIDNIVLDWFYWPEDKWGDHNFDSSRFPDPKGMIDELHNKLNARIMISVWPKLYTGTENYKYMNDKGWVYPGNVENQQKDWIGYVSTFYDPFNPEAREYFWGKMNEKLYGLGIDAWWMDATEPDILSNASIEERKKLMSPVHTGPSAKYYNAFSLVNSKAVYDGQRDIDPDKRVFILTRSAYAGQQRYASVTWSGDIVSRWYDLKAQISSGLNFSLSGIPYWTHDIGGFSLEGRYYNPQGEDLNEWRELNTRWYQFGAFCPLFRAHGQYPFREVFNIAPEDHSAYRSMLYYNKLRYRLMPYIYTIAGNSYHEDYTLMRALMMDFGDDKNVLGIGDQYMFGPAVMVCPVYKYKAREREVYLPEGSGWYDFYTGEYYTGGQTIVVRAPYERIPLFVKEGAIIPVGPEIEYTAQDNAKEFKLFIYKGRSNQFALYEDEQVNYNYEKGAYSVIPFEYNDENKSLKIGERTGTFEGISQVRTIGIVAIDQHSNSGFDPDAEPLMTVEYNGKEQTILLEN
ncbi:Alpha-xylosidase BoGH31A [subsurface metagenome]